MKSLLHNKYVLYLIVLASILNILLLANGKDFNSVVIFIIVGFLTSFFSKNMIVILLIALLFTHGIKYGNKVIRKEGLEGLEGEDGEESKEDEDEEDPKEEDKTVESKNTEILGDDNLQDVIDTSVSKSNDRLKDMANKEADIKEKQATYNKLKQDFSEFQTIQKDILNNMKVIDPLLSKAENFITKFEHFKKNKK
tara:strand:- start:9811 stop:10398 length:588 start_codon:yes stop_codon:yes gene_type:complete